MRTALPTTGSIFVSRPVATLCAAAAACGTALATPLNPAGFPSQGTISLAPGAYTFDTDGLTLSGAGITPLPATLSKDRIAVLAFAALTIPAGAMVQVTGKHPAALLATGSITVGGSLIANGGASPALSAGGGIGNGGGGEGGDGHPHTGDILNTTSSPGYGTGGGGGSRLADTYGVFNVCGGSGGTLGGRGGGPRTTAQFNNLIDSLVAGSGGGGGFGSTGGGGGGAGGGAIELGAFGAVTLQPGSLISVDGGNSSYGQTDGGMTANGAGGGGGSGGAVLIHAPVIAADGTINARGGIGGTGTPGQSGGGSGGGGGAIVMQWGGGPGHTAPSTAGIHVDGGIGTCASGSLGSVRVAQAVVNSIDVDFGEIPIGSARMIPLMLVSGGESGTVISGVLPTTVWPFNFSGPATFTSSFDTGFTAIPCVFTPLGPGEYTSNIQVISDAGPTIIHFRGVGKVPTCLADLGVQGGGYGHDGVLDNNDFVVFIDAFFSHTGCP
jgi:hypothetical protein